MRMRRFLKMFVFTAAFVSARIHAFNIAEVLRKDYGDGEYVAPEGPLNIMRGHPCINNGMIAKQRKYAAPMRLSYGRMGRPNEVGCTYTRKAQGDEVRGPPAGSEALVYLSEHYKTLKSMFTVENDAVVVDKGPQAPFWNLFERKSGKCLELFAALLIISGGGDIRLSFGDSDCMDKGERKAFLVAYDATESSLVLDLESVDSATLAVVEFFVRYGGVKASEVAGYGLHYTDSPSFLIQAYICECIEDSDVGMRIIEAAKGIVAKLPAGDFGAQLGQRFFTTDRGCVDAYAGSYGSLSHVEAVFDGGQSVLLTHWENLGHADYSDGDDSRSIALALLKLCYCLCSNLVLTSHDTAPLDNSGRALPHALGSLAASAYSASLSNTLSRIGLSSVKNWELLRISYESFLAEVRAMAPTSKTIMECFNEDTTTGLATDPKNFLVMLAWALGEPEEKLRSLQQLLNAALDSAGSAAHCQLISARAAEMLNRFSKNAIEAHFCVYTESSGARHGSLWLSFSSDCFDTTCSYAVKLVFKPDRVEALYVSQQTTLKDFLSRTLNAALDRLDTSQDPVPSASAHEKLERHDSPSLRALIHGSIRRCLDPDAHRAVSDVYIAKISAANNPLASHVAISHWMAHQPMRSLGEAVKAGDLLLPVFEKLLARSIKRRDSVQHALTADSPVVAVVDNILGSAAVADEAVRELCSGVLQHSAKRRPDLLPAVLACTDSYSPSVQEWDGSSRDCFLACLAWYEMPEMLLRLAEHRARGRIQAVSSVHGPWGSGVCAAVAECFKLRHEKCILSLGGDTPDVCYSRYSICALTAVAGNPAEYHDMLRSICERRNDMPSMFKAYAILLMTFLKLPRLGSVSPELVAKVFTHNPTGEQIQALLRIFAVFAHTEKDYCGVCSVFHHYRGLLRPEHACEFVELLKSRHDVYKSTLYAISLHIRSPVKAMRTQPPYSAINDLLTDCLKNEFDVKTIYQRVQDLPRK
ncbi:hypothetical protein PAPHI01_2585 [Pancytospora philotis]|nr:hypothetical protein PAPHI01_2585 [Pancytospora philotis]